MLVLLDISQHAAPVELGLLGQQPAGQFVIGLHDLLLPSFALRVVELDQACWLFAHRVRGDCRIYRHLFSLRNFQKLAQNLVVLEI